MYTCFVVPRLKLAASDERVVGKFHLNGPYLMFTFIIARIRFAHVYLHPITRKPKIARAEDPGQARDWQASR